MVYFRSEGKMLNLWCTVPHSWHLSTLFGYLWKQIWVLNFRHLSLTFAFHHLFFQFADRLVWISFHICPLSLFYCHSGRCKAALDLQLSCFTSVLTTDPQELLVPVCPSGASLPPSMGSRRQEKEKIQQWLNAHNLSFRAKAGNVLFA